MRKNSIVEAIDSMGQIKVQGPVSSFMRTPESCGVRFDITPQNKAYAHFAIQRCNDFARSRALPTIDEYLATIDLFAAHSNDAPIDFRAMFECPDVGEVMLFISGIGTRINRATGLISGGWRGKFHVRA